MSTPASPLPHPLLGVGFDSPVEPGSGWPGDPATPRTPVADSAAGVRVLAGSAEGTELAARNSVCRACPRLVEWRERVAREKRAAYAGEPYWGRPVPAFGDPDAEILIVGLAPAAHGANRTGRMFTGDRSGDFLFAGLHQAGYASQPDARAAGDGLTLSGIRIVATVSCAPPQNRPTPEERAACSGWLDRQLDLAAPRLRAILCLGSIGWDAALAAARRLGWAVPVPKPRFGHGAEARLTPPAGRAGGVRLVGCYHVSQQNTFTGKLTRQMLADVLAALREQPPGPRGATWVE